MQRETRSSGQFSLRILVRHRSNDLASFTEAFRLAPTSIAKAGDRIVEVAEGRAGEVHRRSVWMYVDVVEDLASFTSRVKAFCEMFKINVQKISGHLATGGTIVLIVESWGQTDHVVLLKPEELRTLSACGVELGFQAFPMEILREGRSRHH